MIKTIIKRNGSKEAFSADKLNGWSEWSAANLGREVNWSEVVLHTVSTLPETCTSRELQESLIQYCLGKNTWEYSLMAGRLYASLLIRLIHKSDTYPTVKEVHAKLAKAGLMRKLDYTDAEYEEVEKIINHKFNLTYPHYSLHQNRQKYSLLNRHSNTEYETSQFIYMRMAMAAAEFEDKSIRLKEVKEYYLEFAQHKVNIPTPYYTNLGTSHAGYASCMVMTTKDTAASLAAADHIAYMMTVMSAGIGYHLKSRSIGDPVRNGAIEHQGKVPYVRSYVGAMTANKQGSRGGAGTMYYNAFDPEVETIAKLKNPITPLTKQVRGSDYSFGSNALVVRKAAKNEDIALFSYYHAPDLYEAIYSGDQEYFEELYEEFLASNLPRKMVSARKVVINALTEAFETGRHYEHFTDHLNSHTPFHDKIYSGNLCVTGDTLIKYCDEEGKDYVNTIKDFTDSFDENKRYYALSYDFKTKRTVYSLIEDAGITAKTDALYHIIDNLGNTVKCTPDHKIYVADKGYVSAKSVVPGDSLIIETNGVLSASHVVAVHIDIVTEDVYDIKVLDTECFFANGILVHNCVEIALPTAGFNSVKELYESYDESLNFIEFKDEKRKLHHLYSWDRVNTSRGRLLAKDLRLKDVITDESVSADPINVTKIVIRSLSPEIALCNIGGIIVSNIKTDEEYAKSAYRILKLIRYGITQSTYVFKHLSETAKARMNAGVGIVGLAHLMAKKGLSYSSQEGRNFIHELAETHYWHLANASLKLGKEFGNAPWMYKTKWPEGWTPLSTYNKNIDQYVTVENKRDWDALSKAIIENGGIFNSVLAANMPSESCLSKDQKIRTEKGILSLEDIFNMTGANLEEEILSIDPMTGGKWFQLPEAIMVDTMDGQKACTDVWLNGNTNYIEIEMEDGYIFKCTHHHKMLVQDVDGNKTWKLALDLCEGDDIVQLE